MPTGSREERVSIKVFELHDLLDSLGNVSDCGSKEDAVEHVQRCINRGKRLLARASKLHAE